MSDWLSALTIAGGVALLLFAVRYLRKGFDRLFGPRLTPWMQRVGSTRLRAFAAGFVVSLMTPSSTTVSLLAVQSVQAGHMSARQMLVVMLGANVGLTLAVQLLSLHIEQIAPGLILLGVLLFQFTARTLTRGAGQVVLGLGFLLLGIGLMKQGTAAADLAGSADFAALVDAARKYPLLLAGAAIVLSMLLQSSTATIALLIGLSASGTITLETAVPVILGANVGMALTGLVVGWSRVESRRLALGNLLLKAAPAAVGMTVLELAVPALPELPAAGLTFWIAQIHTGFNLLVALLGLPLVGPATAIVSYLVPAPPEDPKDEFGPKFIGNGPIASVPVALSLSLREIEHVSLLVRSMLTDVWAALQHGNERLAREVARRDDQIDLLDESVKRFLTRVVREEANDEDAQEQMRQLRYLSELETIGDIIDKNISELVLKKIRERAEFTEDGRRELDDFYRLIGESFDLAAAVFTTRDRNLARQLVDHSERLRAREADLRDRHFQRLNAGLAQAHETSAIHLDLLTHLKRVDSCLVPLGHAIGKS